VLESLKTLRVIVSSTELATEKDSKKTKNEQNISEQHAGEIALKEIKGHITSISREKTQKGDHLKVTVIGKTENAHVYVHASTGTVTSVAWYSKEPTRQEDDDLDDDIDDDEESGDDD
jgi:uncharacterized membrane protein YkoI